MTLRTPASVSIVLLGGCALAFGHSQRALTYATCGRSTARSTECRHEGTEVASSIEVVIDQGRLSLTLALDADQSDEERSSLVEFIETLRMMSEPESEGGEIRALGAGEGTYIPDAPEGGVR